jgi:DNA-directed RNA polymerase subunit N (RpoN/RPB10)
MLVPIVCFTCGCPIGDKEDLFNYLKQKEIEKNKDVENLNCLYIFELLDIKNDCCKMHMLTAMNFVDYY